MDRSWYVVYTVDVSVPPENLVYLKRKIVDLSIGADLISIDNDFTKKTEDMDGVNVSIDDIEYGKGLRDAYLFSNIVDKINMIEDRADMVGYEVDTHIEEVGYSRVRGSMYNIYIKIRGHISSNDIKTIEDGTFELLSNDLGLPTFYGRSQFVLPLDYPNNIWILDNNYIILQRYVNDDGHGDNILQGPLGIVEIV